MSKASTKVTDESKMWKTHVYDSEGKWVGFFLDDHTAKAWVGKKEGYEITKRPPVAKSRVDSYAPQEGAAEESTQE